jgi:hypothetical protein
MLPRALNWLYLMMALQDTGDTPKIHLKEYGPCEPVPAPNNVVFFFICHKDSQPDYELAKSYFEKGFKTHPNLQDFIP